VGLLTVTVDGGVIRHLLVEPDHAPTNR